MGEVGTVVVGVTVASVRLRLPSCVMPGACEGVGEVCRVGAIAVVVMASVVLGVVIGQPMVAIKGCNYCKCIVL